METMINTALLKQLRRDKAWSQDHLAELSGLSLRTVQRIESTGACSLESRKALASAFEISASLLDINEKIEVRRRVIRRGRRNGSAGMLIGASFAAAAIVWVTWQGALPASKAGIYLGAIGAATGVVCAVIAIVSNRMEMSL